MLRTILKCQSTATSTKSVLNRNVGRSLISHSTRTFTSAAVRTSQSTLPRSHSPLGHPSSASKFTIRSMSEASNVVTDGGPVEKTILELLGSEFEPSYLSVMNESGSHNVPKGSETHFKVVIVSEKFEGVGLLARHRLVNALLKEQLDGCVHALSIVAKTAAQWEKMGNVLEPSPRCLGGSKR